MKLAISLVTATLVSALIAQTERRISYPQDTTKHSSGNIVPLGSFPGSGNFEEGRWQQIIPAALLPQTPGIIVGLSSICQTYTGALVYQSLRINLSHTTATTLGSSFAANMPSPVNVFSHTSHTVNWTAAQWTQISFDVPFSYNGQDNLVIEIQKEAIPIAGGIATMATDGNPGRLDLPRSAYAFGTVGSGAANSTTVAFNSHPLQVRLHWMRTPTMFLKSDRLLSGSGNVFGLGGSIDIGVDASVGSPFVTMIAGAFVPPYSIPGTVGNAVVNPATFLPAGVVSGPTPEILTLNIPVNPFLIGVYLTLQSGVLDVGIGSNIYLTNGNDFFIRTN